MGNEKLQKEQETVESSEDVSSKNPFYRAVKTSCRQNDCRSGKGLR